jgi:hypothetical protein
MEVGDTDGGELLTSWYTERERERETGRGRNKFLPEPTNPLVTYFLQLGGTT